MKKSKKLTKKDKQELSQNPLKWVCNNVGREIEVDLPKEEYYYLIKTDAKPIDVMDCKHVIGGKRYQGMAISFTKKELLSLKRRLENDREKFSRVGKTIRSVESKLDEILLNEGKAWGLGSIKGPSGFTWDLDAIAKELGIDAATNFMRNIQNDIIMERRMRDPYGIKDMPLYSREFKDVK